RGAAGDLDALDAAPDAAARLAERLAVLGGHDARELFEVLFEEGLEPVEHLRARVDGRLSPPGEGIRRRADGGVHVGARREVVPTDDVSDGGIVDVEEGARAGFHPGAADEIVESEDVSAFR